MASIQATLNKMRTYSDSEEVADDVRNAAEKYWSIRAAAQIDGLWRLCKELASHVAQQEDHIEDLNEIINDLKDQCEKKCGSNKND